MGKHEIEILRRAIQEWRDYDFLSEHLFQQLLRRLNRSTDSFSVKESPKWNLSFLPIKSRHAKENETKIIRRALREWKNDGLLSEELFQQLLGSLYPLGESSWNKKLKAFTESDFPTIIASIWKSIIYRILSPKD